MRESRRCLFLTFTRYVQPLSLMQPSPCGLVNLIGKDFSKMRDLREFLRRNPFVLRLCHLLDFGKRLARFLLAIVVVLYMSYLISATYSALDDMHCMF
jgi:hypothetical protein